METLEDCVLQQHRGEKPCLPTLAYPDVTGRWMGSETLYLYLYTGNRIRNRNRNRNGNTSEQSRVPSLASAAFAAFYKLNTLPRVRRITTADNLSLRVFSIAYSLRHGHKNASL